MDQRLRRDIQAWDAIEDHRTGTQGDAATAQSSYRKVMEILDRYPDNPSYQEAKGFVSDSE